MLFIIALRGNYGALPARPYMRSHTCHSTQVNAPHSDHSQRGRYSIYLPQRDGRLSWLRWLLIHCINP